MAGHEFGKPLLVEARTVEMTDEQLGAALAEDPDLSRRVMARNADRIITSPGL